MRAFLVALCAQPLPGFGAGSIAELGPRNVPIVTAERTPGNCEREGPSAKVRAIASGRLRSIRAA